MPDEFTFLSEYVQTKSPAAFAELTRQYANLVYSAAKRQLRGDAHLAEDVTQAVFIVLAQKAKSIRASQPLSAWLLKVTSYCASNARRMRARRELHERKAADMSRELSVEASQWDELAPLLDQGINKLGRADRDAILLRYFEKKSLAEIGQALGVSEEAAQKRVTRAVEKLRAFFRRRGVTTASAAALATLLASESVQAAPAGLTATIGPTAAGASSAAMVAKGAMTAMVIKKAALATVGVVVLLAGVGGGIGGMKKLSGPPPAKAQASGQTVQQAASRPAAAVAFADGTLVHLMALTEMPAGVGAKSWLGSLLGAAAPPPGADATEWWSIDGSSVPPVAMPNMSLVSAGDMPGRRQVRFVFAMRGRGAVFSAAGGNGLAIQVEGVGGSAQSSNARNNERLILHVASMPQDAMQTRIRLGMSSGRWNEVASKPVRPDATTKPTGPALFGDVGDAENGCFVEITGNRIPPGDWRVEAVLTDGRRLASGGWRGFPGGKGHAFFDCRKDEVVKIIGSSRPYEWKTIENVELWPKEAAATQPVVTGRAP